MSTATRRRFLASGLSLTGAAALPRLLSATAATGDVITDDRLATVGGVGTGTTDPTDATPSPPAEPPPSARFLAAVARGELATVTALLTADPGLLHVRDERGRTGFALALLNHHAAVATHLRRRGYEPDLHESALALDWERFEVLGRQAPGLVNQDHPVGGPTLVAAALGGAGDAVWRPYGLGALPDANPRGTEGRTALRVALDHPDLDRAERAAASLLGNAADPNAPQAGGSSPLHAAAARGSVELVEMLVRKGAVIDARDASGATATELADRAGHQAVVELLARQQTIPRDCTTSRTARDAAGKPWQPADLATLDLLTRLRMVGVSHGNLDAVRTLLAARPELAHAVSTQGEHAVEAGAHVGHREIVELLLAGGAPYALPTAVMRGDVTTVRALLDEDPRRVHERGPHDFALLWYPVIGGGNLELATLLLDAGAEVERQHHLGCTALHWAARSGQREMVALLLDRGADPNRRSRRMVPSPGETPLAIAIAKGHTAVAQLLRDRGARA